jgi:hypothetical protein
VLLYFVNSAYLVRLAIWAGNSPVELPCGKSPNPAREVRILSAAAFRRSLGLCVSGRRQKLLQTMVAAKVGGLSIAFGVESGGFVNGHAADGVSGFSRGFSHIFVSYWLLSGFLSTFMLRCLLAIGPMTTRYWSILALRGNIPRA